MQRRVPLPAASLARRQRLAAATGALLLQVAFIAAFLHAFSTQTPPRRLERELTFFLPRLLPKTAPVPTVPRTSAAPANLPAFVPPFLSIAPAPPAAPANNNAAILQNLGRSLFGCAPENYPNLTPQQRAACPPPGEGVAIQNAPDPLNTRSHVKDEAYWKEELRQKQAPQILFGLGGAYGPGEHLSREEAQVEEMTTWNPCPQIANTPCLHNAAQGLPQPGAAGAPPSVKGVRLHPQ